MKANYSERTYPSRALFTLWLVVNESLTGFFEQQKEYVGLDNVPPRIDVNHRLRGSLRED